MNKQELELLNTLKDKELYYFVYNVYETELKNLKSDLELIKKVGFYNYDENLNDDIKNFVYMKKQKGIMSIKHYYIRKYLFKNRSVNVKYDSEYPHYPMLVINGYIQELKARINDIESEIFDLHRSYFLDKMVYKTIHFNNFFKYCLVDCDINSLYYD